MTASLHGIAASNNGTGSGTITMTVPTVSNGDVMIMVLHVRGGSGTTITDPAGWVLLGSQVNSGTTLACKVYWRIASSEPASYDVTITSNKASGVMVTISGANTTQPDSTMFGSQANASSLTIAAPAIGSWGSQNGIALWFGGIAFGGETTTPLPTSYTNATASSSTGGQASTRTESEGGIHLVTGVTAIASQSATWTGTAAVNIGTSVFIKDLVQPTLDTTTTTATTAPNHDDITTTGSVRTTNLTNVTSTAAASTLSYNNITTSGSVRTTDHSDLSTTASIAPLGSNLAQRREAFTGLRPVNMGVSNVRVM